MLEDGEDELGLQATDLRNLLYSLHFCVNVDRYTIVYFTL